MHQFLRYKTKQVDIVNETTYCLCNYEIMQNDVVSSFIDINFDFKYYEIEKVNLFMLRSLFKNIVLKS